MDTIAEIRELAILRSALRIRRMSAVATTRRPWKVVVSVPRSFSNTNLHHDATALPPIALRCAHRLRGARHVNSGETTSKRFIPGGLNPKEVFACDQ